MNRLLVKMLLLLILAIGSLGWMPPVAWSGESVGQERLAYLELARIRSLSKPGVTYHEYRDALVKARVYVGLLRDSSSATADLLRKAMGYYEQALTVWSLQADSQFPVDSLRTDEPNGAAILSQCPGIPSFHYRERDQIFVKDAVDCIWHKSADVLDGAPADIH